MSRILLTHSYHLAYDAKQWRKMQPYPPLGTLYAASALRAAGLDVAVFDPMFLEPISGFRKAVAEHAPRIVVIYEDDFNFVTKMCLVHMRDLACHFARIARSHGLVVIAHGSDVSDHASLFFAHGVDYVLKGEAEQALTDLCLSLLQTGHPSAVPGLVEPSASAAGALHSVPQRKNSAWATLPSAARDLIDLAPYREAWVTRHGFFSTNVVASRGCPYRCNWCAKPISGAHFQLRPPDLVVAEMQHLKSAYGAQHVWFSDDVFALDRHWVEAFATQVESHGSSLPFKIQSRADLMSDATVAALARAGCVEVWMGVESGSQKILDAMTKGLTLAAVHHARRRLGNARVRACFFLQFGYPGEGWEEILETVQLVRDTKPDDIGISISYPLPGTVFYDRVLQQLGSKRNWLESDDLCTIHTAAYTGTFYRALRDAIHADVDAAHALIPQYTCDRLWERVRALEPVSRNAAALPLHTDAPSTTDRAAFLPLASLTAERSRA